MARDLDWISVVKTEGAKRIKEYCRLEAKNGGIKLIDVNWSRDIVKKKAMLMIQAETGSTEIPFESEEIERYTKGEGVNEINARIKSTLKEILRMNLFKP